MMRLAEGGGTEEVDGAKREDGRAREVMAEEVMAPAKGEPIEQLCERVSYHVKLWRCRLDWLTWNGGL